MNNLSIMIYFQFVQHDKDDSEEGTHCERDSDDNFCPFIDIHRLIFQCWVYSWHWCGQSTLMSCHCCRESDFRRLAYFILDGGQVIDLDRSDHQIFGSIAVAWRKQN